MDPEEILDIEVALFVEAVKRRHGYDFGGYAPQSLRRRVLGLASDFGCRRVSDLIPRVLQDEGVLPRMLAGVSVPVSDMFRDPEVFRALRTEVLPLLASYPQVTVWQAGCANGEEVYSLAILLEEAGLYDRTRIYATDINDSALARAEEGIFALKDVQGYAANYREAGGRHTLERYFHTRYDYAIVDAELRRNISFAHHNLVSDGVFCEAQLILCRNVLIYFGNALQQRVLGLFHDSLARGGVLCLGMKEAAPFREGAAPFAPLDGGLRIFRRLPGRDEGRVPSLR